MGSNATLHRLFLTLKSPLMVATSHCAKVNQCSTGNQKGRCETGNTCIPEIADQNNCQMSKPVYF